MESKIKTSALWLTKEDVTTAYFMGSVETRNQVEIISAIIGNGDMQEVGLITIKNGW